MSPSSDSSRFASLAWAGKGRESVSETYMRPPIPSLILTNNTHTEAGGELNSVSIGLGDILLLLGVPWGVDAVDEEDDDNNDDEA